MIELDIENRTVLNLKTVVTDSNIRFDHILNVNVDSGQEDSSIGTIIVHVNPRSYETPMVPECTLECEVVLVMRADADPDGSMYVDTVDKLLSKMERWQKCLDDTHEDFTVAGFNVTGFRLGDGQTLISATDKTRMYRHSFQLYGIVE